MEVILNPSLVPGATGPAPDRAPGGNDARPTAKADFSTFLTLLTAQLRNQDPLQPIDSTEFVAQLADFSIVEQQIQTNAKLDALAAESSAGSLAGFAGWIGREVATTDGKLHATGGPVAFLLPDSLPSGPLDALIRDERGAVLRRFPVVPNVDGQAVWDGRSEAGAPLGDRTVSISLKPRGAGDETAETAALVLRRVRAVSGGESGAVFELDDGTKILPERIAYLR